MELTSRRSSGWRQRVGLAAEQHVERFLGARGCVVLARRFRCRGGEIDLIVLDGDTLTFVEVKARSSTRLGEPEEAVDARKQRRILAAARCFLRRRGHAAAVRFDVAGVRLRRGRAEVSWVRDAFRP